MTDNELLSAISDMLDEKLEQKLEEKLEEKLKQLKVDQASMADDIKQLKADQASMADDIRLLKFDHETEIIPRLKLIESAYLSTYKRYEQSNEQLDRIQLDVDILKLTVAEHSEALKKIS